MQALGSLIDIATAVALQIDPSQGTAAAQRGAAQRIAEPTSYDLIFPVLAFLLVIVLPSATALWVAWRTITEKKGEADET